MISFRLTGMSLGMKGESCLIEKMRHVRRLKESSIGIGKFPSRSAKLLDVTLAQHDRPPTV